jgi:hypothetical protein
MGGNSDVFSPLLWGRQSAWFPEGNSAKLKLVVFATAIHWLVLQLNCWTSKWGHQQIENLEDKSARNLCICKTCHGAHIIDWSRWCASTPFKSEIVAYCSVCVVSSGSGIADIQNPCLSISKWQHLESAYAYIPSSLGRISSFHRLPYCICWSTAIAMRSIPPICTPGCIRLPAASNLLSPFIWMAMIHLNSIYHWIGWRHTWRFECQGVEKKYKRKENSVTVTLLSL